MTGKGALILVCRSEQLDHFGWFARRLHAQLTADGQIDITILEISSSVQLQEILFTCPTPHNVSEIHLFAEFRNERLSS